MILGQRDGGWLPGYYYKNQAEKEKNKKTYFKNITSIYINDYGNITISGRAGSQTYILYTVKQAIKKYNELCRR